MMHRNVNQAAVNVERINDRWIVWIVENGDVDEHNFLLEAHARSFAAGQRSRLRLAQVD
jgi:hypothetical protein